MHSQCDSVCWLQVPVYASCDYLGILIFLFQHKNMQGCEFIIMEGPNDHSPLEE